MEGIWTGDCRMKELGIGAGFGFGITRKLGMDRTCRTYRNFCIGLDAKGKGMFGLESASIIMLELTVVIEPITLREVSHAIESSNTRELPSQIPNIVSERFIAL